MELKNVKKWTFSVKYSYPPLKGWPSKGSTCLQGQESSAPGKTMSTRPSMEIRRMSSQGPVMCQQDLLSCGRNVTNIYPSGSSLLSVVKEIQTGQPPPFLLTVDSMSHFCPLRPHGQSTLRSQCGTDVVCSIVVDPCRWKLQVHYIVQLHYMSPLPLFLLDLGIQAATSSLVGYDARIARPFP